MDDVHLYRGWNDGIETDNRKQPVGIIGDLGNKVKYIAEAGKDHGCIIVEAIAQLIIQCPGKTIQVSERKAENKK